MSRQTYGCAVQACASLRLGHVTIMRSRLLYAPDGRGALLSGNRSDDVNGELDWAVGDGLVKSADLRNFPSLSESVVTM
jgi:hypothetical protein